MEHECDTTGDFGIIRPINTEGSYLEPDTRWRFGYFEAIKEVFTKE